VAQHIMGRSQDQDWSTGKVYLEKNNRALWNSCEPVNNFSMIFGRVNSGNFENEQKLDFTCGRNARLKAGATFEDLVDG
jgi:hypothetical protein